MKKYLLISISLLILNYGYSQTIKASIGAGTLPNSIKIYLKPDLTTNPTIGTLQFNVAIPSSISPVPTLSIVTNSIAGVTTWIIDPAYVEGGFLNYNIYTISSGYNLPCTVNTEFEAMEVKFTGGPSGTFANTAHLVCLPDGGAITTGALFYCTGTTMNSNGQALYYARDANVIFANGNSYSTGANPPPGTFTSFARYIPGITLPSSAATDYYRSITSGDWNAPATWESSPVANFSSGLVSPATLSPDFNANDINIRNGHTVTVTANVTTDQTFVNPGATLVVTASILTVNGTSGLTVQSSAAGTGIIGNSTGTITSSATGVTVERYINSDVVGRKWHLLSGISTTTPQTIRASWQEGGGAPVTPNIGTWVTALGTPAGYDGTSNFPSILTYNPAGPGWANLATTNTGSINAERGYMLFVRGDRFAQPPPNALTAPTVLRTTGTLNQGTQPAVPVLSAGTAYTILGNPFASPIDLENVLTTPNLGQFFYVWDASVPGNNGVGVFRLVQKTGAGTYTSTPVSANDNSLRYIHSGQAFFLKATAGTVNVALNESNKTNLLSVVNPIVYTAGSQQIYTELSIADQGSKEYVTDAVRVWFNDTYSAGTTDDILKIGNFSDNLSSYREGKTWIVENRPMIVKNDTIFLRMGGTAIHSYRFRINTADFVQTNVTAFLQDTWLNTSSQLKLDGSVTNVDFNITSDPASANPDRFRIVFDVKKTDIPVVVAGLKGIAIYPNPVTDKMVNIKFTDMEKGIYQLRLMSTGGQLIMTQQVNHGGGSSTQKMGLDKLIAAGNYQLEIVKPDNSRMIKSLIIAN